MRTRGRHILAAALAVVSLLMLFAAPAAAAERYCFQRKSIKILKDITGLLKKENLKETLSRQKKIAADLEKIRKVSESDYAIAAAIMDCWENVMVNENYPFIIYGGGEYEEATYGRENKRTNTNWSNNTNGSLLGCCFSP